MKGIWLIGIKMVSCKRWKTLFRLPFQWITETPRSWEPEEDVSAIGDFEYAEKSILHNTACTIEVERLIVRCLTCDKIWVENTIPSS